MGKTGLDYFDLDCQNSEKIKFIQAEFGLKGFAVVVKLYQKIYGGLGYFCEWNDDTLLLFMSENGMSCDNKNLIQGIVSACVRRNIFSEKLYKQYGILTSEEIQEKYLAATSRRTEVRVKKEYLLVDNGKFSHNVIIIQENVDRNAKNVDRNAQSRVEKSKSRVYNKNTMCKADALALFEQLWQLYPVKKGKGQVSLSAKKRLLKIGFEEMERAINRYLSELEKDSSWRKPQNGSTFFNSGYVDYLDANYVPGKEELQGKKTNMFNSFEQRNYNSDSLDSLEKKLLSMY